MTDFPLSPDELVTHLQGGTYDGHWKQILDAFKFRASVGEVGMRWRLDLCGMDITEDSLTVGEAEDIEEATRTNWQQLAPGRSARTCRTILQVCLQSRKGLTVEEARETARAVTIAELLEGFSEYEVAAPPLGSAT